MASVLSLSNRIIVLIRACSYGVVTGAVMAIALWAMGLFLGGWVVWLGYASFLPHNCAARKLSNESDFTAETTNGSNEHSNNGVNFEDENNTICNYSIIFHIIVIVIALGSLVYVGIFVYYCFKYSNYKYSNLQENYKVKQLATEIELNRKTRLLNKITDRKLVKFLSNIVKDTWIYDSRIGYDSKSLSHHSINVTHILRVHNERLWTRYRLTCEHNRPDFKYPEQLTSQPILTADKILPNLASKSHDVESSMLGNSVHPLEPGEIYLFHGTKLENVNGIIENGFDISKMKEGLYGKAIYLADSSEKADQYADHRYNRRNKLLAMLLIRVNLGNIHYHQDKSKIAHIIEDSDTEDEVNVKHTIIAGHNKRFREFLVSDSKRCYPEFVIFYDRL